MFRNDEENDLSPEEEARRNKEINQSEASDKRPPDERAIAKKELWPMQKQVGALPGLNETKTKIKESSNALLKRFNEELIQSSGERSEKKTGNKQVGFDEENIHTTREEAQASVRDVKLEKSQTSKSIKENVNEFESLITMLKNMMPKEHWKEYFKFAFDTVKYREKHQEKKIDPKVEAFIILREGIDKLRRQLSDKTNPLSLEDAKDMLKQMVSATISRSDSAQRHNSIFGKVGITKSKVSSALSEFIDIVDNKIQPTKRM